MGSDELISYIEDNYEDLVEKFIEYNQELFDTFCMEHMLNSMGGEEHDPLDDIVQDDD